MWWYSTSPHKNDAIFGGWGCPYVMFTSRSNNSDVKDVSSSSVWSLYWWWLTFFRWQPMTLMRYTELFWIMWIGSLPCIRSNHPSPSIASWKCQRALYLCNGTLGLRVAMALIWNPFTMVLMQLNLVIYFAEGFLYSITVIWLNSWNRRTFLLSSYSILKNSDFQFKTTIEFL